MMNDGINDKPMITMNMLTKTTTITNITTIRNAAILTMMSE